MTDSFVHKEGVGAAEQARYMKELHGVCANVYEIYDAPHGSSISGYRMERLTRDIFYSKPKFLVMEHVIDLLAENVWSVQAPSNKEWPQELHRWLVETKLVDPDLAMEVYATRTGAPRPQTLIHGDPTLSNVMSRASGELVMIDPIRAKGKIPGHAEVDIGKMMQSLIGWEHVMFGWSMPDKDCLEVFEMNFSRHVLQVSVFWLMVHCLRILPYAKRLGAINGPRAVAWCLYNVDYINHNLRREHPCSMLMTLMERSRTLGAPFSQPTEQSE